MPQTTPRKKTVEKPVSPQLEQLQRDPSYYGSGIHNPNRVMFNISYNCHRGFRSLRILLRMFMVSLGICR
jgi:hypothetical protein